MSASTLDTTKYNTVAANTVFDAVLDATAILAWRDNIKTVVNQHASEIDLKANKLQGAWIAPTLLNAWVNLGGATATVGYYKDEFNIVHLRGFIKSGTVVAGTVIFNLPIGYRPIISSDQIAVSSNGSELISRIEITATGSVTIQSGGNTYLSLDGITFRAEQ